MEDMNLLETIQTLKQERHAVILAHNYQRPDVQNLADFTGDSLELARKATAIEAETIVFCGVHFMAETAAILNPDKTVLIPDAHSGCPMADMITAAQLVEFKAQHPAAKVVCYVNSTAEVKAESDCCCTSANAAEIVRHYDGHDVIFVPDQHLGSVVEETLGRKLILWPGYCPTHARINPREIQALKTAHPNALVLAHPECPKPVRIVSDHILSTGQMCTFVKDSPARAFIIATEEGLLHRLRQENPEKAFHRVSPFAVCPNMKLNTVEKVLFCLRDRTPVVSVAEPVAARARRAIEQMLAWS
ncbi:MAG: quinolinate synthase NadA [Kiritimatiellae bacterium]|nr:quinolinate synthase NadA [Kiritimatiellia bacterium]